MPRCGRLSNQTLCDIDTREDFDHGRLLENTRCIVSTKWSKVKSEHVRFFVPANALVLRQAHSCVLQLHANNARHQTYRSKSSDLYNALMSSILNMYIGRWLGRMYMSSASHMWRLIFHNCGYTSCGFMWRIAVRAAIYIPISAVSSWGVAVHSPYDDIWSMVWMIEGKTSRNWNLADARCKTRLDHDTENTSNWPNFINMTLAPGMDSMREYAVEVKWSCKKESHIAQIANAIASAQWCHFRCDASGSSCHG